MTQALHRYFQAPEAHPVLPGRLVRDDVMKTIRPLRRALGISPARLEVLDAMIRSTDATAWSDPNAEPVCYQRQMMIAEETGFSPRMIHACERFFEEIGFLAKRVGADGSRGRFAGGAVLHGLCFSPLIERMPDLVELAAARRAAIARCDGLRRECSAARRVLSRAVAELMVLAADAPQTAEAAQALADFPERYADWSEQALRGLVENARLAASNALEFLDLQQIRSGVSDAPFRPHIHEQTHKKSEDCNGSSVDERTARKRAADYPSGAEPDGPAQCYENKCEADPASHKPKPTESFSPRQLRGAASDDFRFYLDALAGDRLPTELDFILAAQRMLPELAINPTIWDRAAAQMGDLRAALCVLVIDARRFDPVRPIRSAGASLQSFLALNRAGKLNLAGSLIGLIERGRSL
jgi:replication initiation protein RepC